MKLRVKYFVYPLRDLTIKVAKGHQADNKGKCHEVLVQVQGLELQSRFYTLLLDGIDPVLGAKWLAQLGTYTNNLVKQVMEFH